MGALALGLLLTPLVARATLGERADSVDRDRRALAAEARGATARTGYTVHVLVTGGQTIREFADPGGRVFAVTWEGLSRPDLGPLLGAHAAEYRQAAATTARRRGARWSRVAGPQVVVETWGHMRALHGRAYLPALVPGGVTLDAIR